MWDYVDKELSSYNKQYDKINRKTLDEFQSILDNDKDLEEDVTRSDFNRLKRAIEDNYEYLSEYGKYEARKCLKRRRIKYRDWFWFYFFVIYSSQAYMLAQAEKIIFDRVVADTYQREINNLAKDIIPKKKSISGLSDRLLAGANSKGYIWSEYKDAMVLNNTNELYSLFTLQKRANKPLNVDNKAFKKLFEKQKNRIINVNGNKTSGAMDNELIYLANSAKIKAYEDNNIEKCRFIAIHDSKTTEMCRSLDGQVFNVHDWNEFYRYSETNQTKRKYRVYGLIPGVNLPPIDDHYHYCRSTIIYQLGKEIENDTRSTLSIKYNMNFKTAEYVGDLDDLTHGRIDAINKQTGENMGYMEYSIQEDGHVRAENIRVFEEFRRQGVGTGMYKKLKSMFPEGEMEFYDVLPMGELILNKVAEITKRETSKYGRKTFWGRIK